MAWQSWLRENLGEENSLDLTAYMYKDDALIPPRDDSITYNYYVVIQTDYDSMVLWTSSITMVRSKTLLTEQVRGTHTAKE